MCDTGGSVRIFQPLDPDKASRWPKEELKPESISPAKLPAGKTLAQLEEELRIRREHRQQAVQALFRKDEEKHAAILMQRHVRGHRGRKAVAEMKAKAKTPNK